MVEEVRKGDGAPLQGYGTRHLWLKIGANTSQYELHVTDVAKSTLSVSTLCKTGLDVMLYNTFLTVRQRIKKDGVNNVKQDTHC